MEAVFHRHRPEFVGLADRDTTLHSATGHPHREAVAVVVAPGALFIFGGRLTAEFTAPDHEGVLEHAAALEVHQQSRDRLVGRTGVPIVICFEITVGVPVLVVVGATRVDLDETGASLDEAPGEETLPSKVRRLLAVHPVERAGLLALLLHRDGFGRGRLHAVGKFVARDAGGQVRVVKTRREVARIEVVERVDEQALLRRRHALDVLEIEDGAAL